MALLANGTSGDLNNIHFHQIEPRFPVYSGVRLVSRDAAARVHGALAGVAWRDHAEPGASYRELPLAWRTISPELLEWARETEERAPLVMRGDAPGEAFAETGLEFKKRSPFARSFLIELNHAYSGYCPRRGISSSVVTRRGRAPTTSSRRRPTACSVPCWK